MVEGAKWTLLYGPLLAPGIVVVVTLWATAETVTGGYFPVLPENEAQLFKAPLLFPTPPKPETDPCGRPIPPRPGAEPNVSPVEVQSPG